MPERPVTVAIVGDFEIIERGLAEVLATDPRVRIIGRIPETGPTGSTTVDVALFDGYGRAGLAGRVVTGLVHHPRIRHVALFSLDFPAAVVADARQLGVRAFIAKSLPARDLADALVDTAAGHRVDATGPRGAEAVAVRTWPGREDGLSERESDVLLLCGEGLSNREIAAALYLSLETVKTHLKNVYARLGLRNRAQAASYLHRTGSFPRLRPVAWSVVGDRPPQATPAPTTGDDPTHGDPAADEAARSLAAELGLDEVAVAERLELLGLSDAARRRLDPFAGPAGDRCEAVVGRLYDRLLAHEATAPYLEDARTLVRLRRSQEAYTAGLFTSPLDRAHVERMVMVGATHHRVRLAPQWYLATYVHLVCGYLDLLFDDAASDGDAVEATIVLLATVLFDAGLVLDAYELSLTTELVRTADAPTAETAPPAARYAEPTAAEPPPVHRRPMTRVNLTRDEAEVRRRFVGLDAEVVATVHAMAPAIGGAIATVLDDFYALVGTSPSLAALVPPEAVPRLLDQVSAYWVELGRCQFDRAHAASCMRVGVIHERIGLSPQHYLAGLARQVGGLLRALVRPGADVRRDVDALVRAVFFDVTFVIDAYLEARADSLLQTGHYADQLVSGLASGVAIIDERGRIEHANAQLLAMVGTPAGVLRRMPVESALPFPGIAELIEQARHTPHGRTTAVLRARGRHLRLTGIPMRPAIGSPAGLIAVVVDDISDVVRAEAAHERDERTFDHVLAVVEAVVWEIDAETLTVLAVSQPIEAMTGVRDVDLLGRRAFLMHLPSEDGERFAAACAEVADGGHARLDHRLRHVDGTERWVRSAIVGLTDAHGSRTVCGVTVALESDHRG